MRMQPLSPKNRHRWLTRWALTSALLATTDSCPLAGLAQPPRQPTSNDSTAVSQLENAIENAIAIASPSVVAISRAAPQKLAPDELRVGTGFNDFRVNAPADDGAAVVGAGVIIDSTGLVLTQFLSVHEGDQHRITTVDRKTYPATVRAADARSGLAVLAIAPKSQASPLQRAGNTTNPAPTQPASAPSTFPAIRFADTAPLRKGQFVIALGNPFAIKTDGQPSASWGTITNLARKAPAGTNLNDTPGPANDFRTTLHHLGTLIQTDARLGFSTGGGALVNMRGELVGITTTAATIAGHEQPAGYAIPMNAAFRTIIETLKAGREVEYGMMGVGFGQQQLETPTGRTSRLTLLQVYPGSPAARAGLEGGDAVTHVDEKAVSDVDDVQLAVSLLRPATTTTIGYIRGGQSTTARVTLAKLAPLSKNIVSVRPESWQGMRVDYPTALTALELSQAIASATYDPAGCVLVTDVEEDSMAWKAGIRKGMFVNRVGKSRVSTPAEFQAATRDAGDSFDVQLTKPVEPTPEKSKPNASNQE